MIVYDLVWDTIFFGFPVGRVDIQVNSSLNRDFFVRRDVLGYRLIYCFADPMNMRFRDYFLEQGRPIVSRKISYRSTFFQDVNQLIENKCEEIFEVNTGILNLAIQASQFSRFRIDSKFGKGKCEELYTIWIEKSITREIADFVFGYIDRGEVVGLITCKVKEDSGHIGLIAVDEEYRGRSIGNILLNCLRMRLLRDAINVITVETQMDNDMACSFYEKNGFLKSSEIDIYHLWNENTFQ